jgi:hypothetical protein
MTPDDEKLLGRLHEYAKRGRLKIHEHIGGGIQGIVCSTTLPSAIKAFKAEEHYWREVNVYRRIKERNITKVCGFSVPKPIAHHDELLVIHMEIVRPPFVVDFASAGLDGPLFDYTPEVMEEYEAQRKEMFEDRWPQVKRIIAEFKSHGIYLSDVKPGNIMFAT